MDAPVRQAVTIPHYTCAKCSWSWQPRVEQPKVCPKCRSDKWRIAKEDKP